MTVYEYTVQYNSTTARNIAVVSLTFLNPVCLLIDFGIFLYLGNIYIRRRRDFVTNLLLVVALLSFSALIPFAYEYDGGQLRGNLFNFSDGMIVITFLLRIYIICRDVTKSMLAGPVLKTFFIITKLLTFVQLLDALFNFIEICTGEELNGYPHILSNVIETFALFFVAIFRFYYLSLLRGGWGAIFRERKLELFFYLLFVIHEMVISSIAAATGYELESFAGFWMRICIAVLVYLSAVRSKGKSYGISTKGGASVTPTTEATTSKLGTVVTDDGEYH